MSAIRKKLIAIPTNTTMDVKERIEQVLIEGSIDEVQFMINGLTNSIEVNQWGIVTCARLERYECIDLFLKHPLVDIHRCDDLLLHILIEKKQYDLVATLICM